MRLLGGIMLIHNYSQTIASNAQITLSVNHIYFIGCMSRGSYAIYITRYNKAVIVAGTDYESIFSVTIGETGSSVILKNIYNSSLEFNILSFL